MDVLIQSGIPRNPGKQTGKETLVCVTCVVTVLIRINHQRIIREQKSCVQCECIMKDKNGTGTRGAAEPDHRCNVHGDLSPSGGL